MDQLPPPITPNFLFGSEDDPNHGFLILFYDGVRLQHSNAFVLESFQSRCHEAIFHQNQASSRLDSMAKTWLVHERSKP